MNIRRRINANGIEEEPLPSTTAVDEDHLIYQRPQARVSNATKTQEEDTDD